jgi:isopentenyl-diphosphate delta-isomerase
VNTDPTAKQRKQAHIDLAFESTMAQIRSDERFIYEPMFSGNQVDKIDLSSEFNGSTLNAPIWISSMTGGTEAAFMINHRLAEACKKYKLGMGLGSCRSLLYDNDRLEDFAVRKEIGDQPLFANLGIAQVEELIDRNEIHLIKGLVDKLESDGLIIHVNPLQEWTQPEGDRYSVSPLETIRQVVELGDYPVIVKEVGQGMGKRSIKALLKLPLLALDFAAYGGTNFSKLELLRGSDIRKENLKSICQIGHTAEQMINWANELSNEAENKTKHLIISGGVKDFMDGYYFVKKSKFPSLYGQASPFLKYALKGEIALNEFIELQIDGLKTCSAFLDLNE